MVIRKVSSGNITAREKTHWNSKRYKQNYDSKVRFENFELKDRVWLDFWLK